MSGSQPTPPLSTILPINPTTNPTTYAFMHHNVLNPARRAPEAASLPVLALGPRVGTQPQRGVLGLHRLPDHPDQLLTEGTQVCLIT